MQLNMNLGTRPLDSTQSRLSEGVYQLGFAVSQTTSELRGLKQQTFMISHVSGSHLDSSADLG